MSVKSALVVGTLLALGLVSRPALPATASTSFGVTVMVQAAACLVSSSSTTFATYIAAVRDAPSTVSVTCSRSTPYTVRVIEGPALEAMGADQEMTMHRSALTGYALNSSSQRIANRGQRAGGHAIGGRGSAQASLASGALNDAIVVAITY